MFQKCANISQHLHHELQQHFLVFVEKIYYPTNDDSFKKIILKHLLKST